MSATESEPQPESEPADRRGPAARTGAGGNRLAPVYRWELRRLLKQFRIRALLVICAVGPLLFVAAMEVQPTVPADTLFGRAVHDSGFAIPLFMLGFAALWAFPAVAGLVAGDIFSTEDRQGTWSLVATRSIGRGRIVAGKLLAAATASLAAMVVLAVFTLIAGLLFVGHEPLSGLSGQAVSGGHAIGLVLASYGLVVLPTWAFTALAAALSAGTRNGVVGIAGPILIGLALQGIALINLPVWLRLLLPSTAFDGWHGWFTQPSFGSVALIGALVSVAWTIVFAAVTLRLVTRRDLSWS